LVDSEVKSLFESIAPRYDLLNSLLSAGLDREWRRKAANAASVSPGERVLDLCTGTGELAALLAERSGPEGEVVGLDFCAGMLNLAVKKHPENNGRSLVFLHGDALHTPFPDESFDCISIAFGLRNIRPVAALFRETARILRDGGRAVVLELTRPESMLKALYRPYLQGILPVIGGLVSGNKRAYRYLADSIEAFISPEEVEEEMKTAGFTGIWRESLTGGIATLITGRKPA
jgi:demethylmenaquinone methyltransferase/2-methoxy-6-polyprenyl-1,4-benzoquinol methylase